MKKRGRKQPSKAEKSEFDTLYSSDDFRMYCFKVIPCSKNYCHDWTECPFAHTGEKAKRRDPMLFPENGTECAQMKEGGGCPRGDSCPYAHNVFECWLHPTRYRTQLCNEPVSCRRKVCFFAHSVEELREPDAKVAVPPKNTKVDKVPTHPLESIPHSNGNTPRERTTYSAEESAPPPQNRAPTPKDFSDCTTEDARASIDASYYGWQAGIQNSYDRRTVSFDGKAIKTNDRETSVRQSVDISTLSRQGQAKKNVPAPAPMDPLQTLMNEIEAQNIKFSPADISAAVEYLTKVHAPTMEAGNGHQQQNQDSKQAQNQSQMGVINPDSQRDQIIQLLMLLLDNLNDKCPSAPVLAPSRFSTERSSMDSSFSDVNVGCRRPSTSSVDSFTNGHMQLVANGGVDPRAYSPQVQGGQYSQELVSDFIIHENQLRCSMDSNSSDSLHVQQYAGLPPLWEDHPSSQTSLESHEQGMMETRSRVPASASFFYQPSRKSDMYMEHSQVSPQVLPASFPPVHSEGLYGQQ